MFCIQLVGLCLINSKDFGVFSTIFREDSLYGVEWFRQFDKKVKNRCRGIFLILLYDGSIPVCIYLQFDIIFLLRTQVECIGFCVFVVCEQVVVMGLLIVTVVFFLIGLIWCGFVYVGGFLLFFDFVFVKSRSMKNGDREDDVEDGQKDLDGLEFGKGTFFVFNQLEVFFCFEVSGKGRSKRKGLIIQSHITNRSYLFFLFYS